jgi:hypothetical protein
MKKLLVLAALVVIAVATAAGALFVQVGGDLSGARTDMPTRALDLSNYAASPPPEPINLVFLHHSVGTQMLASPGPEGGALNGYPTHPNGGGLAALLAASNYRLHEATYGSRLGERTDLFDWLPKFRGDMDAILAIRRQDERLPDGERNRVVLFKSCFPNNDFVGEGTGDGSPQGPELTEANARATLRAVRDELARHPDVLFVYMTAPPVAPRTWTEPAWKWLVKKALGRPTHDEEVARAGAIARRFNHWVVDPDGWLKGYPLKNVVVFDLYGQLTDGGASDFSRYATGDGADSHPSTEGNTRAAAALVPFLNRAARFAGLLP